MKQTAENAVCFYYYWVLFDLNYFFIITILQYRIDCDIVYSSKAKRRASMNAQFKKGVLELCVMSLLDNEDRYGYELTDEISEKMEIATGTLYLVLKRLKDENYVTTYLMESENGPARKYYHLTDEGRDCHRRLKTEWLEFTKAVEAVIG